MVKGTKPNVGRTYDHLGCEPILNATPIFVVGTFPHPYVYCEIVVGIWVVAFEGQGQFGCCCERAIGVEPIVAAIGRPIRVLGHCQLGRVC
jgi:hypothetical protein